MAVDYIDAEIDRGVNPVRAIENVAQAQGIDYEKLEGVYIEAGRRRSMTEGSVEEFALARSNEYDDQEGALD